MPLTVSANGNQADHGGELESSIRFPALWASQGLVSVIQSIDEVNVCTKAAFKSGIYKRLVLIDSELRKFKVASARKARILFKLSVFDLLGMLEGNPRWRVDLVFRPNPEPVSLDEVKKIIFSSFEKEKDRWDEMMDFEEFQHKIASAASMDEVFATFREFNLG